MYKNIYIYVYQHTPSFQIIPSPKKSPKLLRFMTSRFRSLQSRDFRMSLGAEKRMYPLVIQHSYPSYPSTAKDSSTKLSIQNFSTFPQLTMHELNLRFQPLEFSERND